MDKKRFDEIYSRLVAGEKLNQEEYNLVMDILFKDFELQGKILDELEFL